MGAMSLSGSGSGTGSDTGNGDGKGSGSGEEGSPGEKRAHAGGEIVGRGSTRGKRERPAEILRTRPATLMRKQGDMGTPISLMSNYFRLEGLPNWKLYQFRVDMAPEIDHTGRRKGLLRVHVAKLGRYVFDGTMLFSTRPVCAPGQPLTLTSTSDSDQQIVTITVKLVGTVDPCDYHYVAFFNILLRSCMEELGLSQLGRNYYDGKDKKELPRHKLEVWPGYITSIRQHERSLLLCVDISHKVIRTDTVLDQLRLGMRAGRSGTLDLKAVESALLGQVVMTRYNNKTYRIDGIAWDLSPSNSFDKKDGEPVTYVSYYKDRYNQIIKDVKQPLLVALPKDRDRRGGIHGPVYLVPELCYMTGLSDEQRGNFMLMKDLGEHTRPGPGTRVKALTEFSKRLHSVPKIQENLAAYDLAFSKQLEEFKARILPPEVIMGGTGYTQTYTTEADWSRIFRKWMGLSVASMDKWAIIFPERDTGVVNEFLTCLKSVSPGLGLVLKKPLLFPVLNTRLADYVVELNKIIEKRPDLIMVVIPNNKGDLYPMIKKKCSVEVGVPSQVVTATVLNKPKALNSVAVKVAVQMQAKLGGEPWYVKIPLKKAMVVGYDVYHDSDKKGTSVGAMICSINSTFTRCHSEVDFHTNNTEVSNNINKSLMKGLKSYEEANGTLPERIIFYRDGVGDGQIQFVVEHEVASMLSALKSVVQPPTPPPKLTFIVVSKRINTKFFTAGPNPGNPPSGTVIDDVVTLPERYDFYVISQSVRQGTVNPTSYNVIYDDSGLKPEHIQQLSYKLTHLYFNWPGTVRVPAPCQNAHKLAFQTGTAMHENPHERLADLPHYL